MKNIFKKIGFLCTALLALSLGTSVNKVEEVNAAAKTYNKVTSALSDWSGEYLIVYETGKQIFDGNLSSLDVTSNFYTVSISNSTIKADNKYQFTIAKSGSGYSIKAASGKYIGNASNSNALTSSTSALVNTITFKSANEIDIKGSGGAYLRFNANSGQTRFRYFKSGTYSSQKAIQLYKLVEESGHTHSYTEVVDDLFNKTKADCTTPATYYKSCTCGEIDKNSTFTTGQPLGHEYDEYGFCVRCSLFNGNADESVKTLFEEFFSKDKENEGKYVKETVLNVNSAAMEEVATYFHASAVAKYRKTVYEPGSITMTTSDEEGTYDESTLSKYENKENDKVYHTGLGGNWYAPSDWKSVENKFVTLDDFINTTEKGWTYENGVYTYDLIATTGPTEDNPTALVEEHEMTRLAREFVAPMWLAPNANNYAYAKFDKLTVESNDNYETLIMKLYIKSDNSGILTEKEQKSLIFSEAKITKTKSLVQKTATLDYTGDTTTNMTGNNDAELLGLDSSIFTVIGSTNEGNQKVGLNKSGYIALYSVRASGNGNTLTISSTKATIKNVVITWGEGSNGTATFTVNNIESTTEKTNYDINGSELVIKNTFKDSTAAKNPQLWIDKIVITYTIEE